MGIASPTYGAVKIGKTDAPYKTSTAAFNPFVGELGDYSVIMGNTGGDNRVEFGTRLDHAVWYESPTVNGWQSNFLFAPGQNRSWLSTNLAAGESDCTGNDTPESGGNLPDACNDGSFSDAASANISYTAGGFYATAAAEWHNAVNRQSDITALYGVGTPGSSGCATLASAASEVACQTFFNQDVADEWAVKVGALNKFESGTTVGFIVEHLERDVPADLAFQNERTRWGTWAFLSQQLTKVDSVHVGWAHAFRTPGDPGQHNDATLLTADGAGAFAPNDNQADMITGAYKHDLAPGLTWYTDIAATINGPSAHYDLGAGGRGVTTDCHDAFAADGDFGPDVGAPGPHCYTGTVIVGASTGLQYKF
ncbi:MAG TPA: porin [Xanthobacteraceae bacterium]|nr:porin [Xanthobacteraceae bacterium]